MPALDTLLLAVALAAATGTPTSAPKRCTLITYRWVRPDSSGWAVLRMRADSTRIGRWPRDHTRARWRVVEGDTTTAGDTVVVDYHGQRADVMAASPGPASGLPAAARRVAFHEWDWRGCFPGVDTLPSRRLADGTVVVVPLSRGSVLVDGAEPVVFAIEGSLAGAYVPAELQAVQPRTWWWFGRRRPVLSAEEYVGFLEAMPTYRAWQADAERASRSLEAWGRKHPLLARREPARSLLAQMRHWLRTQREPSVSP